MVRVKHRYLVAQILYPEPPKTTTTNSNPTSNSAPKPPSTTNLSFHRPTPPAITSAHLLRLIREAISDLFGDAGAGLCAASLAGI